MATCVKHLLYRNFLRDDIMHVFEEAIFLAGIQLDSPEHVGELKAVDHYAGIVGKRPRLARCSCPRQRERRPRLQTTGCGRDDDGEIEELAVRSKVELDRVFIEIGGELKVVADVLGQAGLEVALRETFEKLFERVVLARRHHGADAIKQGRIDSSVIANFVYAAIHEVRGRHIELPQIFGLPRGKRFWIDGLDVCIGHQRQHLQERRAANFFREGAYIFSVENIPAQCVRHLQMETNEFQDLVALLGVKVQPRHEAVGEFNTLPGMFAAAPAFAGIVQQQREQEEIEPVNFRQQLRETLFVVVRGWRRLCTLSMVRNVCSSTV